MSELEQQSVSAPKTTGEYHSPAGLSVSKETVPPAAQTFGFASPVSTSGIPRQLSFRELYCARFQCEPEDYFEAVLWRCIYPDRLKLARLLWFLAPDYFTQERYLIGEIATHVDVDSIMAEINDARYRFGSRGFFRGSLHVRLSNQRLIALAKEVFTKAN